MKRFLPFSIWSATINVLTKYSVLFIFLKNKDFKFLHKLDVLFRCIIKDASVFISSSLFTNALMFFYTQEIKSQHHTVLIHFLEFKSDISLLRFSILKSKKGYDDVMKLTLKPFFSR